MSNRRETRSVSGVELTVTYDADGAPILEHDFDYEEAVAPYEAPEQPWGA